MHIYPWQIDLPLLQLSIDLWKTITQHKFHIYIAQCTYTYGRSTPPPPPPIEHRSLENHYTKQVSYIAECTYTHGRLTPPSPHPSIAYRSMQHHYTKEVSHLEECTYTQGRWTPLQLTINLCNVATLNQDNLCRHTDTFHIPIYLRQMDPPIN